jgi:ribosomal protein S18 acetylase RimI-like enzyme
MSEASNASEAPEQGVTVVTTYLHLPTRADFRPATIDDPDVVVLHAQIALVPFYRFLYDAVGRTYQWVDRLSWPDASLGDYLARPTTTLLVLYLRGTPAGYIELDATSARPASGALDAASAGPAGSLGGAAEFGGQGAGCEVAYFGLMPAFHGRGLGKHLLSLGVQRAFDDGAEHVWLHTCTLDGPYALANYRARGFQPFHTMTHQHTLHPLAPRE